MKNSSSGRLKSLLGLSHYRRVALGLGAVGLLASFGAPPVVSAPKSKNPVLQIWPGQRVLLVLPLGLGPDWNADPQLGTALLPVAAPQLQKALMETGKFSVTSPYIFDPILQRALAEKRVPEAEITALTEKPSLETARPVLSKLVFDQPSMIAEVKLEELRVGGTVKAPTVQIQASGRLYEQGNAAPIKSVVATSKPLTGGTPSDRIARAAAMAFTEIAMQFVAAPPAFELPLPKPVATSAPKATLVPQPTPKAMVPAMPAMPEVPITAPNSLTPAPSGSFVPQLPAAQPPLGITVPDEAAGTR